MIGQVNRVKGLRGAILTTTALVGIVQVAPAHAGTAANQAEFETQIAAANADASDTVLISGGFNVANPAVAVTGPVTINLGTNTLGVTGLDGTGSLDVRGSGSASILQLTGANTFNGLRGVSSVIAFDGDSALGTGPITLETQSFQALQDVNVSKAITLAGLGASFITAGHVMTIDGPIGGNAPLIANGGGTLVLAGTNTYTGQTIVDNAILQIGNGGTTGSIDATSGIELSNGTLVFNRADTTTVNAAVSGTGLIFARGPGALTLGGVLTNSGVQAEAGSGGVVLTGTLTTAGSSFAGSSGAALIDQGGTHIVLDGGVIVATSNGGLEDGVQLNGGSLTVNAGSSITAKTTGGYIRTGGGVIHNEGAITGDDSGVNANASGTQTVTVTGGGSYTGGMTGGDTGIVVRTVDGAIVLGTNASALGEVTAARGIDAQSLGAGTIDIVTAGTVTGVGGSGIIANSSTGAISLAIGGDVTAGGFGEGIRVTSSSNANTITIGSAGASSQPTVEGIYGLSVAGGTTTLTNHGTIRSNQPWGYGVYVDSGTLILAEQSGSIEGGIMLGGFGGTLTVDAATPVTLSTPIVGMGTLNQNGSGVLTLTGDSSTLGSFSGTANVNAGTLAVNGVFGDMFSNSTVVNVNAGGTLQGSGTIGGSVNVASGGTVSAGNSPGTLTVTGNYALASGSTSLFELGTPSVAGGVGNDLINVGGDLTLGGTLSLVHAADASASPVAGAYRLYNYGGLLSGSFDAIATPTAQSATVYTTIPGQVNVLIANDGQSIQYWDGIDHTGAAAGGQGGVGVWDAADTNWTGAPNGDVNSTWGSGIGIFAGTAGAVTVVGDHDVQGLQFTVDGYQLIGSGRINLTGDPFSTTNQSFINVDGGVRASISNVLTSTGGAVGLVKLGAGTLTLSGANIYTGHTSVTAGTLSIAGTGSLASSVSVASGAVLENAGTVAGPVFNAGLLASAGILGGGLVNSGTALLAGQVNGVVENGGLVEIMGPTTGITALVNQGQVDLGGNALSVGSLSGSVSGAVLQGGHLTVGSGNSSTTYAGTIADGVGVAVASLTKTGSGTLTLSGASTYTGPTDIVAGGLIVTGSGALASNVAVSNGAVFQNAGMVAGTVTNAGQLASSGILGAGLTNTGTALVSGQVNGTVMNGGTMQLMGATTGVGVLGNEGLLDLGGTAFSVGSLSGSATGAVVRNGHLSAGSDNSSTSYVGTIADGAGVGSLTKVGSGTLTLLSANTYTGATVVAAGTLSIAGSGSLAAGVSVASGATFENAGTVAGPVVNAGTLASDGILGGGLSNTGTALLAGEVNGILENRGTVQIMDAITGVTALVNEGQFDFGGTDFTVASLMGASADAVLSGGHLTTGSDSSTSYAGVIADGTGSILASLTKIGSGTLTLSGANTYTGATNVDAGALYVTGSLASTVNVADGAMLAGAGTIGGLSVVDGGTVAPGVAGTAGTLTVAGNVAFAKESTLQIATTAEGTSNSIAASGTAAIEGGLVRVLAGGTAYDPATRYTILTAGGGVTGTFSTVETNLAFLTPTLAYTGDAVMLDLTRNDVSFGDVARTRNQRAVAAALQGLDVRAAIPEAILSLDADGARSAYSALAGESFAAAPMALVDDGRHVREALLFNGRRSGDGFGLWGDAMDDAGRFDADASSGNSGMKTHRKGIVSGIDFGHGGFRASIAAGYSDGTHRQPAVQSRSSVKSYYAGGTVDYRFDGLRVQAGGAYSWHTLDNSRIVAFADFSDALRSRQHGNSVQGFGELGYTLVDGGSVTLEPFVGYIHQHVSVDGTSETGGAAALDVARVKRGVDLARIGFHFAGKVPVPEIRGVFEPRLSLAYQRGWGDRTGAVTVAFDGASPFEVTGVSLPKNSVQIDGGFTIETGGIRLGASYLGTVGDSQFNHGGRVNFGIRF